MATLNVKSFPDPLYKALQQAAAREHRSVAQQVVHLLSRSLEDPAQTSILDLKGLGKEIWQGIDPAEHVASERDSWD